MLHMSALSAFWIDLNWKEQVQSAQCLKQLLLSHMSSNLYFLQGRKSGSF